ncbi:DUF2063 domain-containing protein [Piscirickettsia litoralis]|uniref:DUF2063 domain-containing protein n=2 Tax=Piscirickettsia litoralis TaxID=1891921 RepID=A0ABX3A8M0_9GAMM|nr:DUF2063 domain-containing protein [Piscirickettsia litoralis]
MPLAKLQDDFQTWVYAGEGDFIKGVAKPPRGNSHERLMIYHHAYYSRLVDIVIDDYPKLRVLLGDEVMVECIRTYVRATPARHFSVRYYGERLSQFLQENEPYNEVPLLAEMAEFEWALNLSLDAADAPVLTTADLANIAAEDWADVVIGFHPSVSLLFVQHGVVELWQSIEENPEHVEPVASELQACFVWRYELASHFVAMDELSGRVWQALNQGKCFGEVCAWLVDKMAEEKTVEYIAGLLQYWLSEGLISKLTVDVNVEAG